MGRSVAVCLFPGYVVLVFVLLRHWHPPALGTYAFLAGAPTALVLLMPRFHSHRFAKSFALTTAVLLVQAGALAALNEVGICLAVLMAPFVTIVGLLSLVMGSRRLIHVRRALARPKVLALILLLLPFAALAEDKVGRRASRAALTSSVVMNVEPATIWSGLVEVSTFSEAEMPRTWLSNLGIPRPVRARVERVGGEEVRGGYFENGLRFIERFTTLRAPKALGLAVQVDPTSLEGNDAVRHAIEGRYLELNEVRYDLVPTSRGTRLSLTCEYTVNTTVTEYAHFAASTVIGQFERELLNALRVRFEGMTVRSAPLLLAEH